ncbi:MAG TPA: DUF465 domain-containing protein [Sphingobium sp.]|uniref:DUF465 domain-containing protein n=1 Tax=Sphingobium sp. TaxID=1912891 RepID=UPI002ED0E956
MNDRIFRLLSRRQTLDAQLQTELARPRPDSIRLLRLKRLKLVVRERLNRLWLAPITPKSPISARMVTA